MCTSATTSTEKLARKKMAQLEELIKAANDKGINTLKEETAIRTAEIFLDYAQWDEENIETNTHHFSLVTRYKDEAEKYAKLLPEFERNDIVVMMNSSLEELQNVIDGKIQRLETPYVDWAKVEVVGDEILYKGRPVFLADWTWKPRTEAYNEYHGNQDGFFLTPSHVINEQGDIDRRVLRDLDTKPTGSAGFVFFNHTNVPDWSVEKDPTIKDGPGIKYTMYDINNPLARDIQRNLIGNTVPQMAGKNYTKLGYMLCNEPHWNTIEKSWAAAPFSDIAYGEWMKWLKTKHKNIATLNKLWGTNYRSFEAIDAPKIMTNKQQGTPLYFDYMAFNQDRVTEWFLFLRNEIQKHDPAAKTHIKVMPNLWTEGKRDSGIDMEAITRNTEIIGNDVSSCGKWMWGEPKHWEEHYAFDWIELCMGQDFFKSVSPNKIMYNTEAHFLTTGKTRDLYQEPQYARCNYWMATIHGLTVSQTWYWCRREDGSSRSNEDSNGYAGSNNHQPRIVNEVHTTIADLNAVSDKIMAFQRQDKPVRIFYTKASSINDINYMDEVFDMYEAVAFAGQPIGFATEGIIKENAHDWDVITIYKTPRAFASDVAALQSYLDKGGCIVMDKESLLMDEYSRKLTKKLRSSKGKLIVVDTLEEAATASLAVAAKGKDALPIVLTQENGTEQPTCLWRVIEGENGAKYLNISNFGNNPSTIHIADKAGVAATAITNVLTGETIANDFVMNTYDTYLLEVK